MDLRTPLRRAAVVRELLVVLVMVAIASLAAAGVAGGDRTARRVSVRGRAPREGFARPGRHAGSLLDSR